MGLMTLGEACKSLRCSDATLRRLVYGKKITYRQIGGRYFFLNEDLEEYLESTRRPMVMAESVEAMV